MIKMRKLIIENIFSLIFFLIWCLIMVYNPSIVGKVFSTIGFIFLLWCFEVQWVWYIYEWFTDRYDKRIEALKEYAKKQNYAMEHPNKKTDFIANKKFDRIIQADAKRTKREIDKRKLELEKYKQSDEYKLKELRAENEELKKEIERLKKIIDSTS